VGDQRHDPDKLPPGNKPSTHCTGGWVVKVVNLIQITGYTGLKT